MSSVIKCGYCNNEHQPWASTVTSQNKIIYECDQGCPRQSVYYFFMIIDSQMAFYGAEVDIHSSIGEFTIKIELDNAAHYSYSVVTKFTDSYAPGRHKYNIHKNTISIHCDKYINQDNYFEFIGFCFAQAQKEILNKCLE